MSRVTYSPRILVVPLDWGLGHATRCIPIIQSLLLCNCTVFLAGEGKTKNLLKKEFPQLNFIPLRGYRITYSTKGWALPFTIARQIPKIFNTIKKEQEWLKKIVSEYQIDAVISDNRYGLYHSGIPSIFITHQLTVKTTLGKKLESWLQRINYKYINRFSECWVPDVKCDTNLGGALSHPAKFPAIPVRYIGFLSRFKGKLVPADKHLLIVLSGPEPQRTIFERLLINQLHTYSKPVVFVRGLPENADSINGARNILFYNHLSAIELEEKISQAFLVISRCGYSTIMDLAVMQKKSILIPTPGQTEQEYLAAYLKEKQFALCIVQKNFDLVSALQAASQFKYLTLKPNAENLLDEAVRNLVGEITVNYK